MIYLKQLIALVACFGLLGLSGCLNGGNSDLGTVTGVVTVDGEPINYATVTFMPHKDELVLDSQTPMAHTNSFTSLARMER